MAELGNGQAPAQAVAPARDDGRIASVTVEWADGSVSTFATADGWYRRRVTGPSGRRKGAPGQLPPGDYFCHEIHWTERGA